ncbi:MAG: hypothetical protein M3179_01145 [Actinomycetota bacterium]|nr:hypothetical protein [Actinomycetota bacterium]
MCVAAGLLAAGAWATPVGAHTVTGVSPTNYRSRIIGMLPPLPGVSLRLLDLGRRVQLTNRGSTDVVVLGYEGEPYLRVGPDGVFENRRSPTVEANEVASELTTTTTTVATPDATGAPPPVPEPEWRRISSGHTARWRDHRTRWEGADPEAVQAAPGQAHIVSQWEIGLQQAGTAAAVRGVITWVPGPSPLPWIVLMVGFLAATVAGAFSRRWGWWLSAALGVLVAADVVSSVAAATASQTSVGGVLLDVVAGGFMATVAWVVGALAIGPLQRQRATGLFAAAITALVLTLYSLPDALGLGRSQLPTDLPPAAARTATAAVIGLGVGLLAAVVVVFKRNPDLLPSNRPEDQPEAAARDQT